MRGPSPYAPWRLLVGIQPVRRVSQEREWERGQMRAARVEAVAQRARVLPSSTERSARFSRAEKRCIPGRLPTCSIWYHAGGGMRAQIPCESSTVYLDEVLRTL